MSELTTSGSLLIGVVVNGVVHRDYVLRTATVQDNIDATEDLIERGENPQSLRISTAIIARQLVSLGTLHQDEDWRKSEITTDLMRSMHPSDWNVLDKGSAELEKKLLRDGPLRKETGGSPVALGATETASIQTT